MPGTVVLTAATSPLGRRVASLVAADPAVEVLKLIDHPDRVADLARLTERTERTGRTGPTAPTGTRIESVPMALTDPDLKQVLEGVDSVVHLGETADLDDLAAALDGTGATVGDIHGTHHLLAAAADAGVRTLVVLSSALVYGAWPNNPVPLTEAAPLRPAPELGFAVARAEVERLVGEWRSDQPAGTTVAVLRPTVAVGPESSTWLAHSPWRPTGLQPDDTEPPSQYVHLDDVAEAVDHARRHRLDGPYNVAPDGWIPAEGLRELSGRGRRVPLPGALAERIASLRWRTGTSGLPPSVLPYAMYPWVIANDRLEATGWHPTHTNEMAYVEADPGGPLTNLDPRRRQLLSLGAAAAAVAALAGVVALVVRRVRRAS